MNSPQLIYFLRNIFSTDFCGERYKSQGLSMRKSKHLGMRVDYERRYEVKKSHDWFVS
jgi:ribosomal protein L13E